MDPSSRLLHTFNLRINLRCTKGRVWADLPCSRAQGRALQCHQAAPTRRQAGMALRMALRQLE